MYDQPIENHPAVRALLDTLQPSVVQGRRIEPTVVLGSADFLPSVVSGSADSFTGVVQLLNSPLPPGGVTTPTRRATTTTQTTTTTAARVGLVNETNVGYFNLEEVLGEHEDLGRCTDGSNDDFLVGI